MVRPAYVLSAMALAVVLSGCQRTSYGSIPQAAPQPLTPAPLGSVNSSQLPAPGVGQPGTIQQAPGQPGVAQPGTGQFPTAPEAPASPAGLDAAVAAAPEITREALVGRWTVSSAGASCDVFLALTPWSGGFRAASRGCIGEPSSISSWDVQEKQVLLSDANGNQIARLYQSAPQRYDGTTAAGQPVSLSR